MRQFLPTAKAGGFLGADRVNTVYVTHDGSVVSAVFDNDPEKSRVVITREDNGEKTGCFTVARDDRPSVATIIVWALEASF